MRRALPVALGLLALVAVAAISPSCSRAARSRRGCVPRSR